jgi:hypothetical protein
MHGIIRFNRSRARVRITGYANWFPLLLFASFIVLSLSSLRGDGDLLFIFPFSISVPLFIFGVLYGIQFYVFNKIFERIRKEYDTDELSQAHY